ncbi:MAG: antibiotic biosynthesis monooxygenase [Myxococcota bacterium]
MIIVAGALYVKASSRDRLLELSRPAVEAARQLEECLDFSVAPDLLEPTRVNIYERWVSSEALTAFRQAGPSSDVASLIERADVCEYEVQ